LVYIETAHLQQVSILLQNSCRLLRISETRRGQKTIGSSGINRMSHAYV